MTNQSTIDHSTIDHSKRRTLKKVAGLGAGSAALSVSSGVFAGVFAGTTLDAQLSADYADTFDGSTIDLADIEIRTRVSSITNDIEVVLKNTGAAKATITDMTPAEIHTARGKFDFNALFKDGALDIESGESITVPLQQFTSHSTSKIRNNFASNYPLNHNLKQKLASTVSIVTDGESLAAVTVVV